MCVVRCLRGGPSHAALQGSPRNVQRRRRESVSEERRLQSKQQGVDRRSARAGRRLDSPFSASPWLCLLAL
jgi:hypothetical protein